MSRCLKCRRSSWYSNSYEFYKSLREVSSGDVPCYNDTIIAGSHLLETPIRNKIHLIVGHVWLAFPFSSQMDPNGRRQTSAGLVLVLISLDRSVLLFRPAHACLDLSIPDLLIEAMSVKSSIIPDLNNGKLSWYDCVIFLLLEKAR